MKVKSFVGYQVSIFLNYGFNIKVIKALEPSSKLEPSGTELELWL